MLFDVQRREREGWTVLVVIGELDLSAVPRVRQVALQALLPGGPAGVEPRVIVDLSAVDFLDSAGLGVVLGVVRRVRQAGGQVAVALDRASAAGRVFSVLELDRVIPLAADVDEVLDRGGAGPLAARPWSADAEPGQGPQPALVAEGGGRDG